jgi:DNA-binding transcriptional LysR family regulator
MTIMSFSCGKEQRMELKEIEYILAIQRYGGVTKASEALYITQSALSKFLKSTEKRLGSPLFSRIGNDMIPTNVGKRYLEYASKISSISEDWQNEYTDLMGEARGEMTVAIPYMRGTCIIPPVMARFGKKYPHVRINLLEESHSVEKMLYASRDVDFVICSNVESSADFVREELGREEIVLVVEKESPLRKNAVQKPGCRYPWLDMHFLAGRPLVLHPPDLTTGKIAESLLKIAGIEPEVLLWTRNSQTALNMAVSGTAACFSAESYVSTNHFSNPPFCFSVGAPKSETRLYAIYRKGKYLPIYARHFLEDVKEVMTEIGGRGN